MGEIGFRFKEKGDPDSYATRVSEAMLKPYAKEDILSGAYVRTSHLLSWAQFLLIPHPCDCIDKFKKLISEWHESEITNILKYFTPSKARINLMSRDGWDKIDLLRNATDQSWLAEKWYGTEYKTMPYDPKNAGNGLESIKEGELFLPGPNEFIPRDLEVEKKDVSEVPFFAIS